MKITLLDAGQLQREIEEQFNVHIHIHDTCGGFYFTLDEPNEAVASYLTAFLTARGEKVTRTDDGLAFGLA